MSATGGCDKRSVPWTTASAVIHPQNDKQQKDQQGTKCSRTHALRSRGSGALFVRAPRLCGVQPKRSDCPCELRVTWDLRRGGLLHYARPVARSSSQEVAATVFSITEEYGYCFIKTKCGGERTVEEEGWLLCRKRAAKTYNDDQCWIFCRIIGHDQGHSLYSLAHSHFITEKTPFPLRFLLLYHPVQAFKLK